MKARTTGLIALCAAVAACNSRTADETATSPQANNQVLGADAASPAPVAMEPAPEGLPSRIAREVITNSGQACTEVSSADRGEDGTITATCAGGERYRVYTAPGQGPAATPL